MKTLWFKQCYVESILNGQKTDTIRRSTSRLPNLGDEVAFSVGPRKPFTTIIITNKEEIDIDSIIDIDRKKRLLNLYPGYNGSLVRLSYKLKTTG